MSVEVENNLDDKSLDDKKKRKRWKKLLSDIHEQLKFYFSDANLRKDRFLKQKIEADKNRYVDISVLLLFNKLKMLTMDADVVARAVKKSSFLQVSEDNKRLRRIHPMMPPKYNIDDVTVYVECLPKTADHSWLQKVFGSCGKVTYVSIPRYKSTGDIKGFSFIEFEKPDEARKACQMLNNPPPDATNKPGKFPKMRKGKTISLDSNPEPYQVQRQRQLMEQKLIKEEREVKKEYEDEVDLENKEPDGKKSKRKRSHDDDENRENVVDTKHKKKSKKQKSEKADKKECEVRDEERRNEDAEENNGKTLKKQKAKKRKLEDEEKVVTQKKKKSSDSDDGNDDDKLKKKRKRKKKPNKLKEGYQYHLRVIPKKEWMQLKKEYIGLQKQSKKELKHNVMEMELQQKTAIRACPKKVAVDEAKSKEPEFTPATVVRITSKESISSRKQLREYLETMAPIAYLDLVDGDSNGFVRVKTAEGASDVISRLKMEDEMSAELLTGDEEKQYWDKLKSDRIARLTSKTKGKKKRGTDRLMDKAERVLTVASRSHIKFED